jgi:phosphate transport system substrate-binding protein
MRKTIFALVTALILAAFTGCTNGEFKPENDITVISREDGSGTRGAFIELFGIQQKDANGNKTDMTVATADINDSTGIVLTNVSSNQNAIGYLSLGALNDTVKALKIDGAEATAENIKNGTYKMSRPFNIATKSGLSAVAQDFISYLLSSEGQAVVEKNGYIAVSDTTAYTGAKPSGKIVIAGSSSVTPVMEKLKEAYLAVNTNAEIEIQQSDSTTGMNSTIEGVCDIGMASRDLKDSETTKGLISTKIAIDGIAVIVNKDNTAGSLTVEQVKNIYTGKYTKWADILGK